MYPKSVIVNQIKTFLDKQFTVDGGKTSEKQKTLHYGLPYIGQTSEKQKTLHYGLPYIGQFSHAIKKKLKHIFERLYKDIDINIVFSPLNLVVLSIVRTPFLNLFSAMSFISLLVQDVKPVILVKLSAI